MGFEKYLAPLDEGLVDENQTKSTLGASVSIYVTEIPDWKTADIALIGVQDLRGANQESVDLEKIRAVLYGYRKPLETSHIIDLGNLISGDSLEETNERIAIITVELLNKNTLPVFFGGTQANDIGIYQAFVKKEEEVSFLSIDKEFDLSYDEKAQDNQCQLNEILLSQPNYLKSFYQLGHQTYLVDEMKLKAFDKSNFETMRLGDLRNNIAHAEPFFRSVEVCSFDVGAIKKSELPASIDAHSFGLTGEEACRLTWYAGMSETIKVFSLSEFQGVTDKQSADVLATLLWYFVEGFYHRKDTFAFETDRYVCFTVPLAGTDATVSFYKSTMTNRWWFRAGIDYVPCNYEDYLETAKGELPDKIFKKVIQ